MRDEKTAEKIMNESFVLLHSTFEQFVEDIFQEGLVMDPAYNIQNVASFPKQHVDLLDYEHRRTKAWADPKANIVIALPPQIFQGENHGMKLSSVEMLYLDCILKETILDKTKKMAPDEVKKMKESIAKLNKSHKNADKLQAVRLEYFLEPHEFRVLPTEFIKGAFDSKGIFIENPNYKLSPIKNEKYIAEQTQEMQKEFEKRKNRGDLQYFIHLDKPKPSSPTMQRQDTYIPKC